MLPRYMSEAVSAAVFTMLAGAACLIGPADFSNRMVEKNLVAIAAYVLLPALAATAWLRTCHPMADSATRNLRWIFGAAARYEASLKSVQSLGNASHSCASAPLPGESPISTISNGTFAGLMSSSAQ